MKKNNKERLAESRLNRTIKESERMVLKEQTNIVFEEEIYFHDKAFFGDNEEHCYDCQCGDGVAICTSSDIDDNNTPRKIRVVYPKRKEILTDRTKSEKVLTYRGLYDLTPKDITHGDIMMACGEIVGVDF